MTTSLNPEKPEPKVSHIQIDRAQYEVTDEKLSGVELRHLPRRQSLPNVTCSKSFLATLT